MNARHDGALADAVETVGGMRIAARNQGLEPGLELGGDWSLTLPLPCGDLLLSVGDVVGHGLSATAAMIGMRHAVAAFAADGRPPAAVLAGLNDLVCERHADLTATAVVARFRPSDGILTWAQAGHPPILLADAGGARPLPSPDGLLMGVLPGQSYAQHRIRVPRGATVCPYTDGMVEWPEGIDPGTDDLLARLAGAPREPGRALAALDFTGLRDDACVLLAQRDPFS